MQQRTQHRVFSQLGRDPLMLHLYVYTTLVDGRPVLHAARRMTQTVTILCRCARVGGLGLGGVFVSWSEF